MPQPHRRCLLLLLHTRNRSKRNRPQPFFLLLHSRYGSPKVEGAASRSKGQGGQSHTRHIQLCAEKSEKSSLRKGNLQINATKQKGKRECVAASKNKRKMLDLNELPPDLNELPHDMDQQQPSIQQGNCTKNGRSVYYTQASHDGNPMGHDNVAGQSSARGAPVVVSLQSESHTLDDTGTEANVPGPTRTELEAGAFDRAVQVMPTLKDLCATPNGPTGRTQGAHNPGDYNPSTMTGRATTGDRDGPTAPLEAASLAQASDDFVPRDPPRSTTKGRAKSRQYKSALELHPKKKNKCSQCQSTEHTAGVCPQRLL
ncbi:hypothetical protein VPH35_052615 [Triticum aestivum]|uniref:Uncharacterized protein n=2 Tax=Triticum TaxID=4564 RepID=A0A077RTS3_WHEAT|nr:unnamed protein product [Triticum aestivum]CDM84055.1 unnamed protein product [Triticum aestivum]VAH78602.1 unnamed protein product [Triticum turgidum subsp. durum]